jgi:hypothetical protein
MNLYVDDVRTAPEGWMRARTIAEAKRWLETGSVEQLSLDHDMGACEGCVDEGLHIGDMETPETTFMNWCPHAEDGTALVRWMIETGHWPKQRPVVHSFNPVGAARMRDMIRDCWE